MTKTKNDRVKHLYLDWRAISAEAIADLAAALEGFGVFLQDHDLGDDDQYHLTISRRKVDRKEVEEEAGERAWRE